MIQYSSTLVTVLVTGLFQQSGGFCCFPPTTTPSHSSVLFARRGRKQPKQQQQRQKKQPATKLPTNTKQCRVTIPQPKSELTSLKIAFDCTIQIAQIDSNDPWWETTSNPYGARVWPASFGIAQYLWQQQKHLDGIRAFEVGCGTGLVSQTVALAGAGVQATDVSPVALQLTQRGWDATAKQQEHQQSSSLLTTSIYDITKPLPNITTAQQQLFLASCVLYEGDLSIAMAQRVKEAYQRGMWILLGDDDTGYREGGRQRFLEQLGSDMSNQIEWKQGTVQCKEMGWREKPFSFLELNAPPN